LETPSEIRQSPHGPLLEVRELTVTYGDNRAPALQSVGLQIRPGEIKGIIGESGSGKSTLALTMLGLLPAKARVRGSVWLQSEDGRQDLLQLAESNWQSIRGAKISMIFQEPSLSFSPVRRIGCQIADGIRAHGFDTEAKAESQALEILEDLLPGKSDRVFKAYLHQLSGGELHRAVIARALACRPALVIADEPTRDLDAAMEAEVLELFQEVNRKTGAAFIFITHNPALLVRLADHVAVMYGGQIVEQGPLTQVFRKPLHPYTSGLLALVSEAVEGTTGRPKHLPVIRGSLSASDLLSRGCTFEPRCPSRSAVCRQDVPVKIAAGGGREVMCFNHGS